MAKNIKCNFCGRGQHQVHRLIRSPAHNHRSAYICNQCVVMCSAMLVNNTEGRDLYDYAWIVPYLEAAGSGMSKEESD